MTKQRPAMETMTASEVRQRFADTINSVGRDEARVIVEKNGVPVAAIIPMQDFRRLQQADTDEREIEALLDAMSKQFEGIPPEEIEQETTRILEEMKAEDRQRRRRSAAGQ